MSPGQLDRDAVAPLGIPTPVQQRMLEEIHTLAVRGTRILEGTRGYWDRTGAIAPPNWFAAFTALGERGRELEVLARAGGVPSRWIDHARAAGERGQRWGASQWPIPEPVDRLRLIDNLAADTRRLGDIVAVHAAYGEHAATADPPETLVRLERALILERERIHGLAALLGLDETEQQRVWPSQDPAWPYAVATPVSTLTGSQLQTRWREHANGVLTHTVDQVHLLRSARIGTVTPTDPLLPSLPEMTEQITRALQNLAEPVEHLAAGAGTTITDAVDAALLEPGSEVLAADRGPGVDQSQAGCGLGSQHVREGIDP